MKVISRRKKKDSRFPIKVECKYCNSILEVEEKDIIHEPFGIESFVCPVCRTAQSLKKE